jgi:hypothetical protein
MSTGSRSWRSSRSSSLRAVNSHYPAALLTQLYGDLAKPGVAQVGQALSTVLGLGDTILWPIQLLNERARIALESNLERYREKVSQIPPEKVAPVPPEIGVPIAEKLSYVADRDLRELYTNLLAKASNIDTVSQAHPSFVNVLNNMSPDEALLIRQFMQQGAIPFVTPKFFNPSKNLWMTLVVLHFDLYSETTLAFPANLPAYVSNLEGLGLIDVVHRDYLVVPVTVYEALERGLEERFKNTPRLEGFTLFRCARSRIDVTPFGWLFIYACVQ